MEPDAWLAALVQRLPAPPADEAGLAAPTDAERDALLDLARIAAHTSERWTAPLSTFLAGVAYATTAADQRAVALRALVAELEAELEEDR